MNLDPNGLQILIQQTRVRESIDNKPFTEYVIELSYQEMKWSVSRKYKNFCELHTSLTQACPNIKFPESSKAIINSSTDINNIVNSKRPTVIDERRKALQQYIRDLARIDLVRNSKPFKNFLEIDLHLDQKSQPATLGQNVAQAGDQKNALPATGISQPPQNRSEIKNIINKFI